MNSIQKKSVSDRCVCVRAIVAGVALLLVNSAVALDLPRDDDEPPLARHRFNEQLSFEGNWSGTVSTLRNFDLDGGSDDHLQYIEGELNGLFIYTPLSELSAFLEVQLDGRTLLSQGDAVGDDAETHAGLEQAYLQVGDDSGSIFLSVGKQPFSDARSWWFDDKFVAARLDWWQHEWFISAAFGRTENVTDDLLHRDDINASRFWLFQAGYHAGKRQSHRLIILSQTDADRELRDNPVHAGFQSVGEFHDDLRYWLNAAVVSGESKQKTLDGYGADVGASYRFDASGKPFITAGLAYGSGDSSSRDGTDRNFRQTGYEDNESRTFGLTSYNLYGESSDFELSNLLVATLGLGLKPDPSTSIECLYHLYKQVVADDDLGSSDVDVDPDGDSTDLGHELDLIFAHRYNDTKFTFTAGVFQPGRAFDSGAESAWLAKLKLSRQF